MPPTFVQAGDSFATFKPTAAAGGVDLAAAIAGGASATSTAKVVRSLATAIGGHASVIATPKTARSLADAIAAHATLTAHEAGAPPSA